MVAGRAFLVGKWPITATSGRVAFESGFLMLQRGLANSVSLQNYEDAIGHLLQGWLWLWESRAEVPSTETHDPRAEQNTSRLYRDCTIQSLKSSWKTQWRSWLLKTIATPAWCQFTPVLSHLKATDGVHEEESGAARRWGCQGHLPLWGQPHGVLAKDLGSQAKSWVWEMRGPGFTPGPVVVSWRSAEPWGASASLPLFCTEAWLTKWTAQLEMRPLHTGFLLAWQAIAALMVGC